MPMGMHNPLPASLRSECKKATKILDSFVNPSFSGNPGREIPSRVLAKAQGLVILTVTKAGFLGSARFGSGILVARLPDGSWSAPSAIATVGGGFGGQVGFELTDFVFILNDARAVRTFSQAGSLTLGGNMSIALGPVGRNAEVATGASHKGVATMFTYSKTKGLFGGLSVEGSALVERRSANRKLYERDITASQLLKGELPPPPEAEGLMRLLNSPAFHPRVPLDVPAPGGVELPATAQHQAPAELHTQSEQQQPQLQHHQQHYQQDHSHPQSPQHQHIQPHQHHSPTSPHRPVSELYADNQSPASSQHRPLSELHTDIPYPESRPPPVPELHSESEERPSSHPPQAIETKGDHDTNVPDTNVPDIGGPDTKGSDTNEPDTNAPHSNVPDTSVLEANAPDTNRPDTSVPDTKLPDSSPDKLPFDLPAEIPYFPPEKTHGGPGATATAPVIPSHNATY